MTVPEARACCAALEIIPWDDHAIVPAITAVSAALLAASPRVTPVAREPGLWWAGASGFGALGGEPALARALLAIARSWHPLARVTVAGSCVAARAATWSASARASGLVIVPPERDVRYLAAAPLALIPMSEELRETLAALGMGTAGAFAALDADDVERRWGAEGLAAWRLARGEDRRRPVLARVDEPRVVDAELPAPTSTMEPVLFLARAAIDALATALVHDGRAAAAIAVTLTLDSARSALPEGAPPHTVTREARFPRPTARAVHLFDQCRALLERWPLTAPACGVRVAVVATAPLSGEQGDLLTPEWRDAAAADAALARLRAELGAGTVVRPVERDEHRPERQGEWEEEHQAAGSRQMAGDDELPTPGSGPSTSDGGPHTSDAKELPVAARNRAAAVLRLLEAPEAVEVERRSGRPAAVRWRGRRHTFARLHGPERLSGDWWRDDGYRREYWRSEDEDTDDLLVFEENGTWYVQGWFD